MATHPTTKIPPSPEVRKLVIETFKHMRDRNEFEFTPRQFMSYLEPVCSEHQVLCPSAIQVNRLLKQYGFRQRCTLVWLLPQGEN